MALEESNPQAAEAIRIGLGLATGGPVKEAVSYTLEKATEVVANMSETAQQALAKVGEASDYLLNLAGSFIQGSTLDEFKGELADETQYPEAYSTENGAALGSSPTDIKDGVVLTASTLGIGAGLGSIKKASSHESGPEGSTTTHTVSSSTTNIDLTPAQMAASERLGVDPRWVNSDGRINWPENRGFYGEPAKVTIEPGTRFDRYGGYYKNGQLMDTGKFVSPEGTPFDQRALPNSTLDKPHTRYEVVKPIPDVDSGNNWGQSKIKSTP